jgi:hypothetical protein
MRISARRTFKGPLVVIDLFGKFDVREKLTVRVPRVVLFIVLGDGRNLLPAFVRFARCARF